MKRLILFVLLFIGIVGSLSAQTKVVRVSRAFDTAAPYAQLGDVIRVQTDLAVPDSDRTKYVLYINGVPFKGIVADKLALDNNGLLFEIKKMDADSSSWRAVYDWPYMTPLPSSITIGMQSAKAPLISGVHNFEMELVRKCRAWLPISLIGIMLVIIVLLSIKTGMIRDDMKLINPFSLARTQLAFWTFIIMGSYILIWLMTGDTPSLTGSVTTLLAISAAGTAGAVIVDRGNPVPTAPKVTPPGVLLKIKEFFVDILTETQGVSMHRLQIVIFTAIIGGVFVQDVIHHLSMPQFDASTLWLMGISTAGYVGLKQTEISNAKTN